MSNGAKPMRDPNKLPTGLGLYRAKGGGYIMYGGSTSKGTAIVVYWSRTGGGIGETPVQQRPLSSLAAFWELIE